MVRCARALFGADKVGTRFGAVEIDDTNTRTSPRGATLNSWTSCQSADDRSGVKLKIMVMIMKEPDLVSAQPLTLQPSSASTMSFCRALCMQELVVTPHGVHTA